MKGISCTLGNGTNILFWACNWFGGIPLRLDFPLLFWRSFFTNATVNEIGVFIEDHWSWHFKGDFESLTGLENSQGEELKSILLNIDPAEEINDKFIWFTNAEGKYLVREGYAESLNKVNVQMLSTNVLEAMSRI